MIVCQLPLPSGLHEVISVLGVAVIVGVDGDVILDGDACANTTLCVLFHQNKFTSNVPLSIASHRSATKLVMMPVCTSRTLALSKYQEPYYVHKTRYDQNNT